MTRFMTILLIMAAFITMPIIGDPVKGGIRNNGIVELQNKYS